MAEPVVAIGIPFRDPGRYFDAALRSVFSQSLPSWELLLIDDGSTDGSLEQARAIRDPRVQVHADGERRGLATRLNQIARLARAPYLARMDADDIMHPQRLQLQLEALRGYRQPTLLGCSAYAIDEQNQVVGAKYSVAPRGLRTEHTFIHPTIMAEAEWFRSHPYSEEGIFARCEDAELWTRCSADTTYAVLPHKLLFYREVGTFSLEKYLETQRGLAEIVRRRFPRPWLTAQLRLWQLSFKANAARVLSALGGTRALVTRRTVDLSAEERAHASQLLEQVLLTPIPQAGHGT
jgi:glycosyltransferase involved in cell wall biosynthesis